MILIACDLDRCQINDLWNSYFLLSEVSFSIRYLFPQGLRFVYRCIMTFGTLSYMLLAALSIAFDEFSCTLYDSHTKRQKKIFTFLRSVISEKKMARIILWQWRFPKKNPKEEADQMLGSRELHALLGIL